jgi:hypothetical protein
VPFFGLLPVWIGTAGWGLLTGRPWSRALVAALAAMALVLFAGTVGAAAQRPVLFGAALAILVLTGAATWYLFSQWTDAWFHRG